MNHQREIIQLAQESASEKATRRIILSKKYIIMKYFLLLLVLIFASLFCNGNSKPNSVSTTTDLKERCSLKPDGGPCRALIPGYYYDAANNTCLQFNYGGCKGSLPFKMKSDCETNCIR